MDELEISGKRYISSRRAAKEHKYHSDYIGQLIRAKKVIGQKVGRSWYVDEESLNAYFSGESVAVPEAPAVAVAKVEKEEAPIVEKEVVEETPVVEEKDSKEEVAPAPIEVEIQKPLEVHNVEEYRIPVHIAKKEEKPRGLTYYADESPLLPEIQKEKLSSEEIRYEEERVEESMPQAKGSRTLFSASLGILGVLVFVVVTGAAYLLSYTTIVEGEQVTASVSIGYKN